METQYISVKSAKTALNLVCWFESKSFSMADSRPAALSSTDPKREIIGQLKSKAIRHAEAEIRELQNEAKRKGVSLSSLIKNLLGVK